MTEYNNPRAGRYPNLNVVKVGIASGFGVTSGASLLPEIFLRSSSMAGGRLETGSARLTFLWDSSEWMEPTSAAGASFFRGGCESVESSWCSSFFNPRERKGISHYIRGSK